MIASNLSSTWNERKETLREKIMDYKGYFWPISFIDLITSEDIENHLK